MATNKQGNLLISNESTLVERIYFNTELTIEEVKQILGQLTFNFNGTMYLPFVSSDLSKGIVIFGISSVQEYIIINIQQEVYFATSAKLAAKLGVTIDWTGWNPNLVNPMEINSYGLTELEGESIGTQNDLLTNLISMNTDFTLSEPITNLPEFLTGIADAIREIKGTTEPINAQNFKPEIRSIKPKVEGLNFGVNGNYNELYALEHYTINRNDEFDFTAELNDTSFKFKKLPMFSVIEESSIINLNDKYKFVMDAVASGDPVTDEMLFKDLKYEYLPDAGLSTFTNSNLGGVGLFMFSFIKDPIWLNELFNTDKFEVDSVYISDQFFTVVENLAGVSFDDVSVTIYAPGRKLLDGVMPININVASNLQDSITITENGTYTPTDGYEGYKQVIVNNTDFKQHAFSGAIEKYAVPDSTTGDYIPFKIKDYTTSIRLRKYGLAGSTYHTIDLTGLSTHSGTGEMSKGYEIAKGFFKGCEAYKIIAPVECAYFYFHEECFADMPNLTEFYTGVINNSSGGAYIYNDVFKNCVSLEKFKIEGLAPIFNDGFAGNTVNGTAYMLVNTFEGCTNLKTVIFDIPIKYARQVPKQYNAFPDNPDLLIYFQDASIDLVKADSTYADLVDKIKPLSEYVEE